MPHLARPLSVGLLGADPCGIAVDAVHQRDVLPALVRLAYGLLLGIWAAVARSVGVLTLARSEAR